MKKIGKIVICLSFLAMILFLTSCASKDIEDIEIVETPQINFVPGEEISINDITGGKLLVKYRNKKEEVKVIENDWYTNVDLVTGKITISYENKNIQSDITGLNYIETSEELIASQNSEENIYIIKEGTYTVPTLRYNKEIILIGENNVEIKMNQVSSSQASALFEENTTLMNLKFTSLVETKTTVVKIGKVGTSTEVPLIDQAYLENVEIHGGKGLNIQAVENVVLNNIKVNIDSTTSSVALAISSGSNVSLRNSVISNGSWGSIAIFGVNANSTQTWYKRKSTLTVRNTTISSTVYIEYYEVSNSEINGLDSWIQSTNNGYLIYTAPQA